MMRPMQVSVSTAGMSDAQVSGVAKMFAEVASRHEDPDAVTEWLYQLAEALVADLEARVGAVAYFDVSLDDPVGDVWRFGDSMDHRRDDDPPATEGA